MPSAIAVTNGGTRLKTPTALPGSAQMLTVDSTGQLATQAIPSGGIGGSLGSTDNVVPRSDGTGGATLQASALSVSDVGVATLADSGLSLKLIPNNSYTGANIVTSGNQLQLQAGAWGVNVTSSAGLIITAGSGNYQGFKESAAGELLAFGSFAGGGVGIVRGRLRAYSYTVATLPSSPSDGQIVFASNGRKSGEGAGAGTGVFCFSDGGSWYADLYNSVAVAA